MRTRGLSSLTLFLTLLWAMLIGPACEPEFTDQECSTSADCFEDEVCDADGQCVDQGAVVTIAAFAASAESVTAGEGVTLTWTITGATTASIEATNGFAYSIPAANLASGAIQVLDLTADTTFTLTASNGEDMPASADVTVTVTPAGNPPSVTSFTTSSSLIQPGATTTLFWLTEGAASGTVTGGDTDYTIPEGDLADGSLEVSPDAETTYTITLTNDDGMATEELTIRIVEQPPATVLGFSADRTQIAQSESVTLSWQTSNAETVTITDDGGNETFTTTTDLETGSTTVTPSATTTYTLRAENPSGGADSDPVTITVIGAPTIDSFTASQTADVLPNAMITLDWAVTGADTVTLTNSAGTELSTGAMNTGSFMATITADETFTLSATNAAGTTTDDISVTVAPPPTINTFSVTPSADVALGSDVTIAWDVADADTVVVADSGGTEVVNSTMATGSQAVTITSGTSFTLTATNAAGATSSNPIAVTVQGLPSITDFSASQTADVVSGTDVTFSWTVVDATGVEIRDSGGAPVSTSSMLTGTADITITADETYTLVATNASGSTTSNPIAVTVLAAPTITSFGLSQTADVVPNSDVTASWVVTGATSIEVKDSGGGVVATSAMNTGSASITITAAETYTLEATNAAGTTTSNPVSVTVLAAPTINSFTASPDADVAPGAMVTLTWDVSGATGVTITNAGGTTVTSSAMNTGSVVVTPNASQTYTLTATNAAGDVTADATVTVAQPPTITSFTATPNTDVAPGTTVTLAWEVTNATGVEITDGGGASVTTSTMATGSFDVVVNANAAYTLTVTGPGGMVSSPPASVTVLPAPTINAFTASPDTDITPGGTTTLSWDVSDAASVEITDSGGASLTTSTMATGTFMATVNANETYTLTATNTSGSATQDVSVTVAGAPVINAFTASPDTDITPGGTTTLSWDVTDATGIEITDSGGASLTTSTMATGTFMATVNANETYTLTATGAGGTATADASVTVALPVPTIDDFEADETNTISGELIQLDWLISDAASAQVTSDQGDSYDVPMGEVALGSVTFRPQVTTVYTITATRMGGGTASADFTVTVGAAPIVITELLYDAAGADSGKEWVELFNAGDTFVDLSHYSLGSGGTGWDAETYQLTGTIAPGATRVVGGPTSDADNGAPDLDQADAFGSIQNGGSGTGAADGVALFFLEAADITGSSTPIDAVLYDGVNIGQTAFPGESGAPIPDADVSPDAPEAGSLVRVGTSDVFTAFATPQPNLALVVTSISTTRGPNQSTDTLTFTGYGFDDALDAVTLGTTPLTCAATLTEMLCDLDLSGGPSTDTGLVDLTITRVNAYTPDGNGDPQVTPLAPADQRTYTLADAFTFDGQVPDSGGDFYCSILDPASDTVTAGTPISFELLLYADGLTQGDPGSLPAGWIGQIGYFDRADNPFEVFDATWVTTTTQVDDPIAPNNEKLGADIVSSAARTAEVGGRVSKDGGLTWTYCDSQSIAGGSDDGWQNAGGVDVEWTP
jgi:hypothetical protein